MLVCKSLDQIRSLVSPSVCLPVKEGHLYGKLRRRTEKLEKRTHKQYEAVFPFVVSIIGV